jgi:hypothetical protein
MRKPIIIIEYEDGTILPVVAIERMEGPMIPEEIGISIDSLGEKKENYEVHVFKFKGTYPVEEYDRKSGNETE